MIASIRVCPFGRSFLRHTNFRPSLSPGTMTASLSRSPGRSFSSSSPLSMSPPYMASPQQNILCDLRQKRYNKWGWVIYRCTYDDDEAWSRFKDIVNQRSRQDIAESDAPEIVDYLEWTFIEDRNTLDNASKDQLRAHFKAWAADAANAEIPQLEKSPSATYGNPRYDYFVQVDEGALRSVVYGAPQPPDPDLDGFGFVNLVRADWVPMNEELAAEGLPYEDDGETYEPIEGCCEEDVGWMVVPSRNLSASFYGSMFGLEVWHAIYQRPPEMMYW